MEQNEKIRLIIEKTADNLGKRYSKSDYETMSYRELREGVVNAVKHLQSSLYPDVFGHWSINDNDVKTFIERELESAM